MTEPSDTAVPSPRGGRARVLSIVASCAAIIILVGVVAGFRYHTNYVEVIPGDAISVAPRVQIKGVKVYKPTKGEFDLLYVRERQHLSYWSYLQAKYLHDNVSLIEVDPRDEPPVSDDVMNACDMTDSQLTAKLVALDRLGYKVDVKPGLQILQVSTANAASALHCNDVIRAVDGRAIQTRDDLTQAMAGRKPGSSLKIGYERNGTRSAATIRLSSDESGKPLIGVFVQQPTVLPFSIKIRTDDIGGPSAGLSMTLALLDQLTPGELTGGKRVAVTGTINPDGTVGGIGGTPQKVVAARRRGADLFIVGADSNDLAQAKKLAGPMKVVVVHTLDDALRALRTAGGDPLPKVRG